MLQTLAIKNATNRWPSETKRISWKKLSLFAYFPKKYAPDILPIKEKESHPNRKVLINSAKLVEQVAPWLVACVFIKYKPAHAKN